MALRCNLVDQPDNKRKVHKRPIPRVGGVAVASAYFLALLLVSLFLSYRHTELGNGLNVIRAIAPSALLIFLVGLADDLFDLKPHHKLGVQILAAVMAIVAGIRIHNIGSFHLQSWAGIAITLLWLTLCTNAVNLIDGLDGLAAGISLLATVAVLIGSLMTGNVGLTIAVLPLAGALLGFLVFNFNPASIFMGDSGSLLLGFLLGCYSIVWTSTYTSPLQAAVPLMALAIPVLDTSLAITRRFLSGQPIFRPDRSHIHHRLLARGFSHRTTVLLLYGSAAAAGALSLCLLGARGPWEIVFLALFVGCVLFGIRELGYIEFDALRAVLVSGNIRRDITAYVAIRNFEDGLTSAKTAGECWLALKAGCEEFGLEAVRMHLGGDVFHGERPVPRSWAMRIPISTEDWVELCHASDSLRYPSAILPFADMVRRVLADKSTFWNQDHAPATTFSTTLYPTMARTAH